MSRFYKLGAILYENEGSWGENTNTYANRVPILKVVDPSGLEQAKLDPDFVCQYRNDGTRYIPGPKGGTFKTATYLPGHGSTTAGATTVNALETFHGGVLGNAVASAASGTTCQAGWTAVTGNTVASGTFSAGSIAWFGVKGDGRADGQPAAIATHVANAMTLLTALPGVPANTDVVYSSVLVYGNEIAANATVTPRRFLLQTANMIYRCHGCFPMSFVITGTGPNQLLMIEVTWGVSWWEEAASAGGEAFPTAVAVTQDRPSPNATGSMFFQLNGTTTRQVVDYRNLTITCDLGIEPQEGPGGVNQYQRYINAIRTKDTWRVEWTENQEAPTAAPTRKGQWDADVDYHLLIGFQTTVGKRMAIYFPRIYFVDEQPGQFEEKNINRLRVKLMAGASNTTTNDQTLAAAKVAYG